MALVRYCKGYFDTDVKRCDGGKWLRSAQALWSEMFEELARTIRNWRQPNNRGRSSGLRVQGLGTKRH